MYAIVKTGSKQYRVEEGQRIEVERLGEPGTDVELTPVLLVDGDATLATPEQLNGAKVTGKVLDEHRGRKIHGFTYKSKANVRKRWGHRQTLATVEITKITKG